MVGGTVSIFYRDTDGTIATRQRPVVEPPNLRRAHLATPLHAIIFANGGEFKGKVKAEDFLLPTGEGMVSILNSDGKIKGDYIDAKGINIKDPSTGETILSMDSTGIHWAAKYSPIQVRYSTNKTAAVPGGWAETWNGSWSGEVWAIHSYDGGATWTSPQRVQGANGRNGSDASVTYDNIKAALQKAASTQSSFITADEMGAPMIYGGKIFGAEMYANEYNVFPQDNSDFTGSFNLYGNYGGIPYHFLCIRYGDSGFYTPTISFASPGGAPVNWDFETSRFRGNIYFSGEIGFDSASKITWGKNAPTAVFA